jgi:hypothetical protein
VPPTPRILPGYVTAPATGSIAAPVHRAVIRTGSRRGTWPARRGRDARSTSSGVLSFGVRSRAPWILLACCEHWVCPSAAPQKSLRGSQGLAGVGEAEGARGVECLAGVAGEASACSVTSSRSPDGGQGPHKPPVTAAGRAVQGTTGHYQPCWTRTAGTQIAPVRARLRWLGEHVSRSATHTDRRAAIQGPCISMQCGSHHELTHLTLSGPGPLPAQPGSGTPRVKIRARERRPGSVGLRRNRRAPQAVPDGGGRRGREGSAEPERGERPGADPAADRRAVGRHAGGVRGCLRVGLAGGGCWRTTGSTRTWCTRCGVQGDRLGPAEERQGPARQGGELRRRCAAPSRQWHWLHRCTASR